jgi:hypothetical protein
MVVHFFLYIYEADFENYSVINTNIFVFFIKTPFPVSPMGEMISSGLLPPWEKVGRGYIGSIKI